LELLENQGKMVGAVRFELVKAHFTKALKTKERQQHQWFQWVCAFSLRCNKMNQNPFRVIEKDRIFAGEFCAHFLRSDRSEQG
jgi:hypothetical protein